MALSRKFLKFDRGVHVLFGILAAFSIIMILPSLGTSLIILFYCFPLLMMWQLFSVLLFVFIYQNKARAYYLLAMVIMELLVYFLKVL